MSELLQMAFMLIIALIHEIVWYLPYSPIEGAIAIGGLFGALIWIQVEENDVGYVNVNRLLVQTA